MFAVLLDRYKFCHFAQSGFRIALSILEAASGFYNNHN